ncbi:MAG: CotH kinase family protein, partial [Bacteroidales bacterium]|nr:CotH kinase family protein [Bacteroidales bacterium]
DTVLPLDVHFSLEGGFYNGAQTLELIADQSPGSIRYTDDGSWPTTSSMLYSAPILITETTVIRARLFEDLKLPSNVTTQTYILDDHSSLPVVSISTDPENFFSNDLGIYVVGTQGVTGWCMDTPVNWNNDWERPVNIEYFDHNKEQMVNQLVGTKIYGGCSRMWRYKSLALYARNRYSGNRMNHAFFNTKEVDEFKTLVLRNSGNDAYVSMFRDGFMQSLLFGQMDLDLQGFQPSTVFINGEYWGIQNVREKINEHHPATNYDIDPDRIDMLERLRYFSLGEVVSGSGVHYAELTDYMENNDLGIQENFEYVETQMDVNQFMNYYVANIYFQNEDWPHNNVKYWRPQVEGGKWRWILYDTDFGWGYLVRTNNCLEWATRVDESTLFFRKLLENDGFKNEFIQRMAGHINTTFHPDRVTTIFDSIKGMVDQEMNRHIDRWSKPELDYYQHQTEVVMPSFTEDRPDIQRDHVIDKFGLSGMYILSAGVNDPSRGFIQTSGVAVPDNYSGSYFNTVPLRVVAIPRSGYKFSHWEGASGSASETIILELSADASINAVFEPDTPVDHVYINEVCASNVTSSMDEWGQTNDWIEIYNDNDFDVNIAGWYLSDSAEYELKY